MYKVIFEDKVYFIKREVIIECKVDLFDSLSLMMHSEMAIDAKTFNVIKCRNVNVCGDLPTITLVAQGSTR